MAGNATVPGQSVSSKLLTVLGCFDVARPALSLTEIAERADLPLSTAYRLIRELREWGGLVRLDDGRYQVGIRLWTIGSLAPQQRKLRDAAWPFMNELLQRTQENVLLTVPDGLEALCIEKFASTTAVRIPTQVGARVPLHTTGVGKSILAFSCSELLAEVVDYGLTRRTSYSITEPGRLAATLEVVRSSRVAYSYQEMAVGAVSVASPIVGASGRVHAAVGIVCRSSTAITRFSQVVYAAAHGIAHAIS
jgi:DNA-binding IclR family transcriptional regulator